MMFFALLIALLGIGMTICTLVIHAAACSLHVWAMDKAKLPHNRWYRYCRFMARLIGE